VLIGGVLFGSADVNAAALVRVRERVPDVIVLVSRDDLERRHGREVMEALAKLLIDKEVVNAEQLRALLGPSGAV